MRIPLPSQKHLRGLGPKPLDLGTANRSSHALLSGEWCVTRTSMVHALHAGRQVSFPFGDTGFLAGFRASRRARQLIE
jgi:hypothetical protein